MVKQKIIRLHKNPCVPREARPARPYLVTRGHYLRSGPLICHVLKELVDKAIVTRGNTDER